MVRGIEEKAGNLRFNCKLMLRIIGRSFVVGSLPLAFTLSPSQSEGVGAVEGFNALGYNDDQRRPHQNAHTNGRY
jgi:hypothetical protein